MSLDKHRLRAPSHWFFAPDRSRADGAECAVLGTQFSVVSGGLVCVAGVGILSALFPSFARYDAEDPVP